MKGRAVGIKLELAPLVLNMRTLTTGQKVYNKLALLEIYIIEIEIYLFQMVRSQVDQKSRSRSLYLIIMLNKIYINQINGK